MRSSLILTIILALLINRAYSQSPDTEILQFQLINNRTKKPIVFAHIYNESKRFGTISDSTGHFSMKANMGDTLIFMALGYLGKYYAISDSNIDTIIDIYLTERYYEIEEVSIQIPGSYTQLKKAILKLNTQETKIFKELPSYNKYKTPLLYDTNIIHSAGFMIMHPVSGLYYRFSKEEKSKRKAFYLQQQEMRQGRVDQKYNRNLVSKITGLQDKELTQFIGYCSFSFNYLFETSPFDINYKIEEKYKEYLIYCKSLNRE